MITGKNFIKVLGDLTGWPAADLRTRLRHLVEAEAIPKGKGGRSGAGAVAIAPKDAAMILLSLAAPEKKTAPEYARRLATFRGEHGQPLINAVIFGLTWEPGHDFVERVRLPAMLGGWDNEAVVDWTVMDEHGLVTERYHERTPRKQKKVKRSSARPAKKLAPGRLRRIERKGFAYVSVDVRLAGELLVDLGQMFRDDASEGNV